MSGSKNVRRTSRAPARVTRLLPIILSLPASMIPGSVAAQDSSQAHMGHGDMGGRHPAAWRMPPMDMPMAMMNFLGERTPDVTAFVPGATLSADERMALPTADAPEVLELADGDSIDLDAGLVRRDLGGQTVVMYAFNGQAPGPVLKVKQHSTIVVNFTNNIEFPTTLRWHGVRVQNDYDGVPGLTQRPVRPGQSFRYEIRFPDAGVFWYHPHQHEDIAQDLGLYGNIFVEPADAAYYSPVNREEALLLDDLLIDELGLFPWGFEAPTHALMGRFGNLLLVNGRTDYRLSVRRGEVVRFYLTNASNTRTFNLSWGGAPIKVIAGDLGKFEREARVSSVIIAPGQRYTVEVMFDEPGEFALTNRIQAIDHFMGRFYSRTDSLGIVTVSSETTDVDHAQRFARLREHEDVQKDIDRVRTHFDRPADHELVLTLQAAGLPTPVLELMAADSLYVPPMEWNETMPMMNWLATGMEVTWALRDGAAASAGEEFGPAVGWRFDEGDVVKLRLFNDPKAIHPMHHPMHLHGQRFLVLEQDGVRSTNLVWRDTVIVPVGSTVDLLVEMSNPGRWMLNCQIPEHMGSGMAITLTVDPVS